MTNLTKNMQRRYRSPRHPQQGATLIMGLLILLILTIIGGVAMNGSSLELKMSANVLQKSTSFQESEDARELAEGAVTAVVTTIKGGGNFPGATNGYYDVTGGEAKADVSNIDFWSDTNAANYVSVNANNKYVIEYLGQKNVVLDDRTSSALVYVFRLSVLGVGNDGVSQTLAQTVHMKN